jgi:hypothetical protein
MNFTNITLFNRYVVGHDVFYQRTLLYKVDWGEPNRFLATPAKYNTQIKIPMAQTLNYRLPKDWLTDEENTWTLQLDDIIIKGIANVQVAAVSDLYGNYSLTDLKKNFELVTITEIHLDNKSISQQYLTIGAN